MIGPHYRYQAPGLHRRFSHSLRHVSGMFEPCRGWSLFNRRAWIIPWSEFFHLLFLWTWLYILAPALPPLWESDSDVAVLLINSILGGFMISLILVHD